MSIENVFTPSDGSGSPIINNTAIQGGVTLTRSVNGADSLLLGSCCAAKVEFNLLDFDGNFENLTGKEFCYTRNGIQEGYFIIDTAERQNEYGWKVTAYDRMILFDKNIDEMITLLSEDFTLSSLYASLCAYIGVEAATQEITNSDFSIKKNFSGSEITGRDMLYWIAEASGSYAFINSSGKVQLGFYGSGDEKTVNRSAYFSLTKADFSTKPINKLQIHKNENDIGCIVEAEQAASEDAVINAYCIQNNPLFYTDNGDSLNPAASAILNKIKDFCYVPFECELLVSADSPNIGDVIIIKTQNGVDVKSVVMEYRTNGVKATVSATGTAEANSLKSKNLSLKASNLRTNELSRTLESTVSTLSHTVTKDELGIKLEELSSSFTQTAKEIMIEISDSKTAIDNLTEEQNLLEEKIENGVSKVNTTTVTIDAGGIEVGNSGTEIHTQMKPDEFNILQGNNMRIRVNTEGTILQSTIIQDDLTVGTVKMIDRENGIDFVVLGG